MGPTWHTQGAAGLPAVRRPRDVSLLLTHWSDSDPVPLGEGKWVEVLGANAGRIMAAVSGDVTRV